MEGISDFHFLRPFCLLLLLLPALCLWYLERRMSDPAERWRSVIDPELLHYLIVGTEARRRLTPSALLLAAWTLATIAVAGPAWQREPSPFADARPPLMAVLKVAPSMLATDLAPTRLDRAKQKLSDLVKLREGASTGLIAYSGSSHLVLPPTADSDVVLAMAEALVPHIMPKEGDDLAAAVTEAQRVLDRAGQSGSILVLADSVAGDQISRLAQEAVPTAILAMIEPDLGAPDASLREAAGSLGAAYSRTTVDGSDVAALAARFDRAVEVRDVAGEGARWKDAGYWLIPLLALVTLFWFRRGFVLE